VLPPPAKLTGWRRPLAFLCTTPPASAGPCQACLTSSSRACGPYSRLRWALALPRPTSAPLGGAATMCMVRSRCPLRGGQHLRLRASLPDNHNSCRAVQPRYKLCSCRRPHARGPWPAPTSLHPFDALHAHCAACPLQTLPPEQIIHTRLGLAGTTARPARPLHILLHTRVRAFARTHTHTLSLSLSLSLLPQVTGSQSRPRPASAPQRASQSPRASCCS
jgi:hypothetical protein